VVVDVDPREIGKLGFEIAVPAVADAGRFLAALSAEKPAWDDSEGWLERCREWKRRYAVGPLEAPRDDAPVDTYAFVDVLSDALRPGDLLVPGSSGSCAEITMQAVRVKAGVRIMNTPGLGSMGFGLPASIGAAVASGGRVVTIVGDGGLQHNIQELETVRRLGLPIAIFVLDNGGYASIRASQSRHFGALLGADPDSGLTLPDTVRVARAYGLKAFRVTGNAGLAAGVRRALRGRGPVVCELMVDRDLETQPRLSTTVAADGTIESRPLEDLWPFLDRGELAANMGVGGGAGAAAAARAAATTVAEDTR